MTIAQLRIHDVGEKPRSQTKARASGSSSKFRQSRRIRPSLAENSPEDESRMRRASDMSLVGQMASGVAHDFNNRLQFVMNALDLLKVRLEQGRAGECDALVESAQDSLMSAASMTRQLLNFARPSMAMQSRIDINRAVGSMETILKCVTGRLIELRTELAAEAMTVCCDRHQLENALLNLVVNARDAMPKGGRISIETCQAQLETDVEGLKRGRYARISVSDTGTGMREEVMKRAFEPFFTTKPAGKGTGLGLAMIKTFVDQLGGHIHLQSAEGAGTAISIYLPCT